MMPERNVSKEVMSWMHMGSYESSIDAQKCDANRIVIKKCPLLGCGNTFIDFRNHYWQFHSNIIEPDKMKSIRAANTVTEPQKPNAKDSGSNIKENDELANGAKSETVYEAHSIQLAKDSSNGSPEVETDKELAPVLGYRSEFNLENNNEPVKVNNNEHIHAGKHESDPSDDNGKKNADTEENTGNKGTTYAKESKIEHGINDIVETEQLSRTKPADGKSIDNNSENGAKTPVESVSDIHIPEDKKYSHNNSEALPSKLCEERVKKTSSLNIHMEKFAKVSKFIPARRPDQARIGEMIHFMYSPDNNSSIYWLQGVIKKE